MNVISASIIVFGSYFLVKLFEQNLFFRDFMESMLKVSDLQGTAVLMLPLGFTIGVIINLIIHWVGFNKHFPTFSPLVLRTFFQVFSASVIMGFITYIGLNVFDKVFDINTLFGVFLQGFLSGILGIVFAVVVLYLLKNRELAEVWSTLHKKIWRTTVIVPDAELQ